MSPDKDKLLCEKYPKIFKQRFKDPTTTAMCWGFECGDGWYNILDNACHLIQNHIDWNRKQRANSIRFNRALRRALAGDTEGLYHYYDSHGFNNIEKDIASAVSKATFREVPYAIPQVEAMQVKEKFGGLRFYYSGGDSYIDGVTAMAESMSYVTCEECGKPGTQTSGGWIQTLCDEHKSK
jgi:hypothetical protein